MECFFHNTVDVRVTKTIVLTKVDQRLEHGSLWLD
jgi:hypothetical protein